MGLTIQYKGALANNTTIDELFTYCKEYANKNSLEYHLPSEQEHRFTIPNPIIETPKEPFKGNLTNEHAIRTYANKLLEKTTNTTYKELCNKLNKTTFTQKQLNLWIHEDIEPLRFAFVKHRELGETANTTIKKMLNLNTFKQPIKKYDSARDTHIVHAELESWTKVRENKFLYENVNFLKDIREKYFGGKLEISDDFKNKY